MKNILLCLVINILVHHGVVAEIELYPDVTSDDYPLDDLSVILNNQHQRQLYLQQRERQLAEAMAAAEAEAEAVAEAEAEAEAVRAMEAAETAATLSHRLQFAREAPLQPLQGSASQVPLARLGLAAAEGPEMDVGDAEPAFSYREPGGQAADGEAAPFAVSPSDPRFYEEARLQNAELAGGEVYRSGDYSFRGEDEAPSESRAEGGGGASGDDERWVQDSLMQQPQQQQQLPAAVPQGKALKLPAAAEERQAGPALGSDSVVADAPAASAPAVPGVPGVPAAGTIAPGTKKASADDVMAPAARPANAAGGAPPYGNLQVPGVPAGPIPAPHQDGSDYGGEMASYPQAASGQVEQTEMAMDNSDVYFIAIVAGCCAAAVVGIIGVGISWYRLQKNAKAAADVEYPAYGVTGPNKDVSPTGDRKLAHSAQMYHYQHQKQQIIAMESRIPAERNGSVSDAESEEENEEGDYTVYECPGLAPTCEMEVKNPLFHDDPTPASPATGSGLASEAGLPGTTASGGASSLSAPHGASKHTTKDHVIGESKQQKP